MNDYSVETNNIIMVAPSVQEIRHLVYKENPDSEFNEWMFSTYDSPYCISDNLIISVLVLKKYLPDEIILIVQYYIFDDFELNLNLIKKIKYIPKYANVQICDKELLGCLKLSRIIYKYFNLQNTRENKLANIENIIRLISIYYDSLIPTNIFQFYNIQPLQLQFSRLFVQFN